MIAMLKAIGIEAAYAGVRTADRGPVFWEVPQAQTNHIITYVPAQAGIEKELFLDGTARYGNMFYLPDRDQGIEALVLDGKGHQILTTPLLPAETSTMASRLQARIVGNKLIAEVEERWTGWFASRHRARLNVEGKRSEELTKEIAYRFPGARISADRYQGLADLGPEASVRFHMELADRVRREGNTLRINLLWPSNLVRSTARKPERHADVFFVVRTNMELSATLQVPAGSKVLRLPEHLLIDNDLLHFKQECNLNLATVTCTRNLRFKSRRVPKARYQQYRELCRRIDRAEAQDIVLEVM